VLRKAEKNVYVYKQLNSQKLIDMHSATYKLRQPLMLDDTIYDKLWHKFMLWIGKDSRSRIVAWDLGTIFVALHAHYDKLHDNVLKIPNLWIDNRNTLKVEVISVRKVVSWNWI
jgi:hypothetical protein